MIETNPLKINKALKMHSNCPNCNLKYMMEPSFYYGAMYVNYALSVAVGLVTFVLAQLIFDLSLVDCIIPVLLALLLAMPFTLRISRIIWINFFVRFRKEFSTS